MKKFEEEFDKNVTSVALRQDGESVITVCDYKEAKAFGHDWVSPEDHQKVVESNKAYETSNLRMSEENAKFVVENIELAKEIAELKSQLEKRQPEIPEFVAEYIKETADPIHEMCAWSEHYGDNGTKCDEPELSKMLDWFGMNRNMFYEAVIKGYTVAKEKRFYLKNKLTGLYLYESKKGFFEQENLALELTSRCDYTQQEIDSMETGSYEQIPVEVEE